MAYGLKWFSEFKDVKGRLYRVEILERDYSGSFSEVTSGGTPVIIELASDYSSDPFTPIRPQKATFEWICESGSDFNIQNLHITDDQKFRVIVKLEADAIWYGYLTFTDCEEPYISEPYPVTFSATCGLAFLERNEILDPDGKYYTESIRLGDVIVSALKKIGHGIDIVDCVNLTEPNSVLVSNFSFLHSVSIEGDGLRGENYLTQISGLLNAANAFITQVYGQWVIQDVRGLTQPLIPARIRNSDWELINTGSLNKRVSIIPPGETELEYYLRPTHDVIDKLAYQKSKITLNVHPGIQVNRLKNGAFKSTNGTTPDFWGVYGGALGKDISSGDGTIDNPYKLDMSWNSWNPVNVGGVMSEPIELNIGNASSPRPESYNIRIKGYCTVRGSSTPYSFFKVTLNQAEKEYPTWLQSSGDWKEPTKRTKVIAAYGFPDPAIFPYVPISDTSEIKTYEGAEIHTLEFESKPITNWVNEGGIWKTYIRLGILMPPPFFELQAETPRIWVEDFAITIDTGTPYEGDHVYELDATKTILNGDDYSYDITVADKINIETLEQKRTINRVMTGYSYVSILPTSKWQRLISGSPDPEDPTQMPLQYLSMRERARLMCGKRRNFDGKFVGHGIYPDSVLVNTIEPGSNPYGVTNWSWNLKDNEYNLCLFELTFPKLSNEEIKLVIEDSGGRRGRKTVSGSVGGSGSSGSGSLNPIAFADIPNYGGVVGKKFDLSIDLFEYVVSNHTEGELVLRQLVSPTWATVVLAEDSLVVEITGTPDEAGVNQALIEVSDGSGDEYIISIPITIYPAPVVTFNLNTTALAPRQPVKLPYTPPYTLTIGVKGEHDAYEFEYRRGGAVVIDTGIVPVTPTGTTTYIPISGDPLGEGINVFFLRLLRQTGTDDLGDPIYTEIYAGDPIVALGITPEDPDFTVNLSLVSGGSTLGQIPGTYEYVEEWDIQPEPVGMKYDELFISILPEEAPYTATLTPTLTPVSFTTTDAKLDVSTGAVTPDAGYKTTSAIPVASGEEYWTEGVYSVVGFLGSTKVASLTGDAIKVPAGVDNIRLCWPVSAGIVQLYTQEGTLFGGDTAKAPGEYTVFVRATQGGVQVYERMESLTILPPVTPDPVKQAGIILLGAGNPAPATDLPMSGYVSALPANWSLLFKGFGATQVDKITWKVLHGLNGLTELNIPMYTGKQAEASFTTPVSSMTQLLFWGKQSTEMGNLHVSPTRVVAEVTGWMNGEKVAISEADWIFSNEIPGPSSGLHFVTIATGDLGSGTEVISITTVEANAPESGRFYVRPVPTNYWGAFSPTIDGSTVFSRVEIELDGVLVKNLTLTAPAATITSLDQLSLLNWGVTDTDGFRKTGSLQIDKLGEHTIIQRFYNGATLLETRSMSFTLIGSDIKDPNECCSSGGESPSGEGFSQLIGNGVDRIYEIPHTFGSRPLHVEVYRVSDQAKTYPSINTPAGKVVVGFKSPLALNARTVRIRVL